MTVNAPGSPGKMIEISDLVKNYGSTCALRGVSFEVPRGQVVGFLGPNGAGKSTAMRILTGYLPPTSGEVRVAGLDVGEDPVAARRSIGYLPESNPLYEEMMVQEYLEYSAEIHGLESTVRGTQIDAAVDRCGLGDVRGRDIGELSKGFRQRVGLAQAILHDPDLLILDEPTTGLDPNQVVEIRELIKELGREKTVLMSTHILPEVQATCSRVLILSDGQVVADDAPDHLARAGGHVEVAIAAQQGDLGDRAGVRSRLKVLPGVLEVVDAEADERDGAGVLAFSLRVAEGDPRRELFACAVDAGWILLRIDAHRISLEETFRRLTTVEQ